MAENQAVEAIRDRLAEERRCCTVCDAKKRCHGCGNQTLYACSDCRIDFGVTVYVCNAAKCRNAHEEKCSARLRAELDALRGENERLKRSINLPYIPEENILRVDDGDD